MSKTPARSSFARRVVQIAGFSTMLLSLLAFAGALDWRLDLLSHFRFQYLLILILSVIATALLRLWKSAGVLAIAVVINGLLLAPLFLEREVERNNTNPPIRLAAINVHTSNRNFQAVIDYVRNEQPDIVFFQETNIAWISSLTEGLQQYRLLERRPREDNFGVLVMVRVASESNGLFVAGSSVLILESKDASVPSVEVRFRWHGVPMRMLCVHTLPPTSGAYALGRDNMFGAAAQWSNNAWASGDRKSGLKEPSNGPVWSTVIMGDLNATRWSSSFQKLLKKTDMVDSSCGFGWQPTWPGTSFSISSIPIDHCLHSADLVTVRREVGEGGNGSDHLPLLVELAPVAR